MPQPGTTRRGLLVLSGGAALAGAMAGAREPCMAPVPQKQITHEIPRSIPTSTCVSRVYPESNPCPRTSRGSTRDRPRKWRNDSKPR